MNEKKNYIHPEQIIERINHKEPNLLAGEKVLALLDREEVEFIFLRSAYLLVDGKVVQVLSISTDMDGEHDSDTVEICREGDSEPVVSWHATRRNSKTKQPNGIRIHDEELIADVIFFNAGSGRITVDGTWVEPGEYHSIIEIGPGSPEFQKAMEAFLNSPETQESVRKAQEDYRRNHSDGK